MSKNLKKKIAVISAIAMLIAICVSGSLAFFTDTAEVTNTFTVGDVSIEIVEEFEQDQTILPLGPNGDNKIVKVVSVKNSSVKGKGTGGSDAYIRAFVGVPLTLADYIHFGYQDAYGFNSANWDLNHEDYIAEKDGILYKVRMFTYKTAIGPQATTEAIFDRVWLDSSLDVNHETGELVTVDYTTGEKTGTGFTLKALSERYMYIPVVSQAVQAAGFNDPYTAFTSAFADKYPWPEGEKPVAAANFVVDNETGTVEGIEEGFAGGPIAIPEGTNKIAADAFKGHTEITEVVLPASVTDIGEGAFEGCSGIKKVTFNVSDGKTAEINAGAFSNCSGLEEFVVNGDAIIGSESFACEYTSAWKSVDFVFDGDVVVQPWAFGNDGTALGDSTIYFKGDVSFEKAPGSSTALTTTFMMSSIKELKFAAGTLINIPSCIAMEVHLNRVIFEGKPAEGSVIDEYAFECVCVPFEGVYIGSCSVDDWTNMGLPGFFKGQGAFTGCAVTAGLPTA